MRKILILIAIVLMSMPAQAVNLMEYEELYTYRLTKYCTENNIPYSVKFGNNLETLDLDNGLKYVRTAAGDMVIDSSDLTIKNIAIHTYNYSKDRDFNTGLVYSSYAAMSALEYDHSYDLPSSEFDPFEKAFEISSSISNKITELGSADKIFAYSGKEYDYYYMFTLDLGPSGTETSVSLYAILR